MTKKISYVCAAAAVHPFPKTFVFIQPLKKTGWLLKMKVPFSDKNIFFGWYDVLNLFNGEIRKIEFLSFSLNMR